MKNKVLVEVIVPMIEERYDIYLPINKKIGNIINLLCRSINEFTDDSLGMSSGIALYNNSTGDKYNVDEILRNTDIRNGSILILM